MDLVSSMEGENVSTYFFPRLSIIVAVRGLGSSVGSRVVVGNRSLGVKGSAAGVTSEDRGRRITRISAASTTGRADRASVDCLRGVADLHIVIAPKIDQAKTRRQRPHVVSTDIIKMAGQCPSTKSAV